MGSFWRADGLALARNFQIKFKVTHYPSGRLEITSMPPVVKDNTHSEKEMSEFKRPPGVSHDPEFCYRSGYQHGAWAVFQALEARLDSADQAGLRTWIEIDLQKWRHDRNTSPRPPDI
jgi:hypothetical protein